MSKRNLMPEKKPRATQVLCAMPLCPNRIRVDSSAQFPAYCDNHKDKRTAR